MARLCHCCASEYLQQIDARLRRGDAQSAIASEFGLSADSVARHAKHVDRGSKSDSSISEKWRNILRRAETLFDAASVQGDTRAALSALGQQAAALESSLKFSAKSSGFDALTTDEKSSRIVADKELLRSVLDKLISPGSGGLGFSAFVSKSEAATIAYRTFGAGACSRAKTDNDADKLGSSSNVLTTKALQ